MVRFLHTSDWQLGMTRYFLSEGTQERYNQARFDAIRNIGRIASDESCEFVVVCGDVFESNQVDRKTIARALEALRSIHVPVYILPGNHDPLNEASVYNSTAFVTAKSSNVFLVTNETPIEVSDAVQLVGAPWTSKRMALNAFDGLVTSLEPMKERTRIVLAHGIVDSFAVKPDDPGVLSSERLEDVVARRQASFIALGDRHSLTSLGNSGRIWYSGTPEMTDFDEPKAGYVNVVELDRDSVVSKPIQLGQWKFVEKERVDINSAQDIDALRKLTDSIENKERAILKMNLIGAISLAEEAELQHVIDTASQLFASLQIFKGGLIVLPNISDFSEYGFSGFAETTIQHLIGEASGESLQKETARDALMLAVRLAGGRQ